MVQIHPFIDGNKRTGMGDSQPLRQYSMDWVLACDADVAAWMMLGYAPHKLNEEQLTDLVGRHHYQLA